MSMNFMTVVSKLLGRENYNDWAFTVENYLIIEGLWNSVLGMEEDDEKNTKAKAKLLLTFDPTLFIHVKEAEDAKEIWETLKKMYDDSGFIRKITLLRSLISVRLDNCDSMTSYINQIIETSQKLRGTGFKINDEWIASLILAGLPDKFFAMIMAIEHFGITISTDAMKTKLLDIDENGSTRNGSAFVDKTLFRNKVCNNDSNKRGSTDGEKRHGGTSRRNDSCNINKKDMSSIKCFRCKQIGHFQNECPKRAENNSGNYSNAFNAVFLSGEFKKTDWYVDSGASAHLTSNEELLRNKNDKLIVKEIMIADQRKIPVICSGIVELKTKINKKPFDIKVKNILCVPDLTINLSSASQLIQNEHSVSFEDDCCKIYNKYNELVATADLINGVYKLNTLETKSCLFASSYTTEDVWHRRFGHINSEYLHKMNNGLVEGLKFSGPQKFEKQNCIVCCEAKQT